MPATTRLSGQFGRYRIVKLLGEGAMGSVYLARDTNLDRDVALKVPQFVDGKEPQIIARFYQEARAAATVHHPHVCPVYDVGGDRRRPLGWKPPDRAADLRRGDWNRLEPTVKGNAVAVRVNGAEVNGADLAGSPAVEKLLGHAAPATGRIGLQVANGTVHVRNAEVQDLSPAAP
jgi:hypothetical protein